MAEQVGRPLREGIVGHENILERLSFAQSQGRLASTFLFVGPDGVGRKKVALALGQNLVCESSAGETAGACGHCGACLRLAKMQSEALLILSPEKNSIKIEQASQVIEFFGLRSISKARIVIIDSAHLLNATAANTLLKILEEPPANSYFFLIAPGPQHVLSTLRSRAQVVRFSALNIDEMKKKSIKTAASSEWALRASQGSFSRLAGFQDPDELATRDSAARFLELWLTDKKAFVTPEWREIVRDRSSALGVARYCGLLLRDAAIAQAANCLSAKDLQRNSQIVNADRVELLTQLAKMELSQLLQLGQKMYAVESGLQSNRDPQLAFEEFWLS